MAQNNRATPDDYRDIFEIDKRGQRIFEDLWLRFAKHAVTEGGIDAVLKTFERMGQRKVLEFITLQINRANGVNDDNQPNEEQP